MKVLVESNRDVECSVLVVGVCAPLKGIPAELAKADEKLGGAIGQIIKDRSFEGEFGQLCSFASLGKLPQKNILLVGLGKESEVTLDVLRKAAGISARAVRDSLGAKDFATVLHEVEVPKSTGKERAAAVAEGTILGAYQFTKYKTVDVQKLKKLERVLIIGEGLDDAVKRAVAVAECTVFVRDLQNEPASNLHPKELAEHARDLEKNGVKVAVYDKKAIEKLGLHALLAVNRGSVHEPRFVVMEYAGGGKKKIALVGKGITFDSGGLQIKPGDSMVTMKCDMSGAGVVIGTVRAAAELKLPVHLFGVFAATENMPGMDAYKPGDVVNTYSGKTIEIAHTDAEGRVILSDALAWTEKNVKPDVMVDLATLTGACVVALGSVCAGVMGKDEAVIRQLVGAGVKTGERVWQLPFYKEYHDQIKSEIADVRNLGNIQKEGGAITAGAFLSQFVEKTPWAHIDIAGPAWSEQDLEYVRKGGTGFGVRLLVQFLEEFR